MSYYQRDLAFIHDRGYGLHADRCAPGILELLSGIGDGLVLEFGCGSGALTRHLLAAGLRVVATDASPTCSRWPGHWAGADLRLLACPAIRCPPRTRTSRSATRSATCPTRPPSTGTGGPGRGAATGRVLALDILDLDYGRIRKASRRRPGRGDWAIITAFSRRPRTGSSATAPRSSPTAPGRGAAAASTTRTCSWTRPGSRRCWPGTACGLGRDAAFGDAELPAGLRSVTGSKD